jgi:hypothetical protein
MSEAIQNVRAVVGGTLTDAVNELVAALRDGEVHARWWGTNEIIDATEWYRSATLFEDGRVEYAFEMGRHTPAFSITSRTPTIIAAC